MKGHMLLVYSCVVLALAQTAVAYHSIRRGMGVFPGMEFGNERNMQHKEYGGNKAGIKLNLATNNNLLEFNAQPSASSSVFVPFSGKPYHKFDDFGYVNPRYLGNLLRHRKRHGHSKSKQSYRNVDLKTDVLDLHSNTAVAQQVEQNTPEAVGGNEIEALEARNKHLDKLITKLEASEEKMLKEDAKILGGYRNARAKRNEAPRATSARPFHKFHNHKPHNLLGHRKHHHIGNTVTYHRSQEPNTASMQGGPAHFHGDQSKLSQGYSADMETDVNPAFTTGFVNTKKSDIPSMYRYDSAPLNAHAQYEKISAEKQVEGNVMEEHSADIEPNHETYKPFDKLNIESAYPPVSYESHYSSRRFKRHRHSVSKHNNDLVETYRVSTETNFEQISYDNKHHRSMQQSHYFESESGSMPLPTHDDMHSKELKDSSMYRNEPLQVGRQDEDCHGQMGHQQKYRERKDSYGHKQDSYKLPLDINAYSSPNEAKVDSDNNYPANAEQHKVVMEGQIDRNSISLLDAVPKVKPEDVNVKRESKGLNFAPYKYLDEHEHESSTLSSLTVPKKKKPFFHKFEHYKPHFALNHRRRHHHGRAKRHTRRLEPYAATRCGNEGPLMMPQGKRVLLQIHAWPPLASERISPQQSKAIKTDRNKYRHLDLGSNKGQTKRKLREDNGNDGSYACEDLLDSSLNEDTYDGHSKPRLISNEQDSKNTESYKDEDRFNSKLNDHRFGSHSKRRLISNEQDSENMGSYKDENPFKFNLNDHRFGSQSKPRLMSNEQDFENVGSYKAEDTFKSSLNDHTFGSHRKPRLISNEQDSENMGSYKDEDPFKSHVTDHSYGSHSVNMESYKNGHYFKSPSIYCTHGNPSCSKHPLKSPLNDNRFDSTSTLSHSNLEQDIKNVGSHAQEHPFKCQFSEYTSDSSVAKGPVPPNAHPHQNALHEQGHVDEQTHNKPSMIHQSALTGKYDEYNVDPTNDSAAHASPITKTEYNIFEDTPEILRNFLNEVKPHKVQQQLIDDYSQDMYESEPSEYFNHDRGHHSGGLLHRLGKRNDEYN